LKQTIAKLETKIKSQSEQESRLKVELKTLQVKNEKIALDQGKKSKTWATEKRH
jgi:cell division protein FtsL